MKTIITLIAATIGFQSFAENVELKIVDKSICQERGNRIFNCTAPALNETLVSLADYIPLETEITINREGSCKIVYPVWVKAAANDGSLTRFNIFQESSMKVDQFGITSLNVSVNAPYSKFSYFRENCSITANVALNQVNKPKLKTNLEALIDQAGTELDLVSKLIDKQQTIIELVSIINLFNDVVSAGEATLNDYYALNALLTANCLEEPCTWTDQVFRIIDENLDIAFEDQALLFQLAEQLDLLTPEGCEAGDCAASLIDDETRAAINRVLTQVGSEDVLIAELEELIQDKKALENLIAEYQAVANQYGVVLAE